MTRQVLVTAGLLTSLLTLPASSEAGFLRATGKAVARCPIAKGIAKGSVSAAKGVAKGVMAVARVVY